MDFFFSPPYLNVYAYTQAPGCKSVQVLCRTFVAAKIELSGMQPS